MAGGDAQAGHHRPRQRADRPVARRGTSASPTRPTAASAAASPTCASTPTDNGYARPVEGVVASSTRPAARCSRSSTTASCRSRREPGGYYADDVGPLRTDLKPLEIMQPEGPSFTVDGNLVQWQKWSLRVASTRYEGLVLHTVGYEDGGRTRPVLHRASISEMVVPYGDPGPMHGWKNAFDAGEWGLGRLANSLALGCDCLGEIHYFDAVARRRAGRPVHGRERASASTRRTTGSSGSTSDLNTGDTEVRRSRRLVVSVHRAPSATTSTASTGTSTWTASIQLEVKLTGIIPPMAVAPGDSRRLRADGRARARGARTTSTCSASASTSTSTAPTNSVYEVDVEPLPPATGNPWANALRRRGHAAGDGAGGAAPRRPGAQPALAIVNPTSHERARPAHGVQAAADGSTPTLLADPESSVGEARRLRHATTSGSRPTSRDERRAAGELPEPARRRRRAARAGPPPTGRSWTPTSCSGTRSASPTSRGPRTGRSCRSSTPASCSSPGRVLRPQPRARRRPVEQRALRLAA